MPPLAIPLGMVSGLPLTDIMERYLRNITTRSPVAIRMPKEPAISQIAKKDCVNRTWEEAALPGERGGGYVQDQDQG